MSISTRSYCYLLLWFGFIVLCAHLTPYFANDYRYMLITGTQDLVSSVSDIFVSQYRHYFEWGGRTVAHVIAQYLLFIGKPASAVIQAICYLLLILFVYYNAYGVKPTLKLHLRPLIVITLLLFLQLRAYGEVVLNIVSSANYMYTLVLVLMFLLPYRISMWRPVVLHPILLWPMMLVLGVLAGWSNESTGAAVATGLGLYLLFNLKRHQLKLWQCVGYLGFLIGFGLLILAPGNQARLDYMEDGGFDYFNHLFSSLKIFGQTLLTCGLLLICIIYLWLKIHAHCIQFKALPMYHGSLWFIGMGIFSLVLMIFSPNFPVRASTTFVVFDIIGILGLAKVVTSHYHHVMPRFLEKLVFGVVGLFTLAAMSNAIWAYLLINENIQVRSAELLSQRDTGAQELVVTPLEVRTYKYLYVADVRSNPNYWTNKIVANFYRVNSITRTQDLKDLPYLYDFKFFTSRLTADDFLPPQTPATPNASASSQASAQASGSSAPAQVASGN